MTRKHFEQLAAALKHELGYINLNNYSPSDMIMARQGWWRGVTAVVSVAAASNPRFNRKRFYEACGINVDNYKG